MVDLKSIEEILFITFCINLISLIEFGLLLYVNLKMNSYFETKLDKIERGIYE